MGYGNVVSLMQKGCMPKRLNFQQLLTWSGGFAVKKLEKFKLLLLYPAGGACHVCFLKCGLSRLYSLYNL